MILLFVTCHLIFLCFLSIWTAPPHWVFGCFVFDLGAFVFEIWVLRFRCRGLRFRDLGASCFGLRFRVLRFRNYPCQCFISCSLFFVNMTMLEALRLRFFGGSRQLRTSNHVTSASPSGWRFEFLVCTAGPCSRGLTTSFFCTLTHHNPTFDRYTTF